MKSSGQISASVLHQTNRVSPGF